MPKFKAGDRVKMFNGDRYCHGEITIVRDYDSTCKVMFDEDWAPNYWYYRQEDLELENEPNEDD